MLGGAGSTPSATKNSMVLELLYRDDSPMCCLMILYKLLKLQEGMSQQQTRFLIKIKI